MMRPPGERRSTLPSVKVGLRADRQLGFGQAIAGLEPISVRSVERLAEAVAQLGAQAAALGSTDPDQ